MTNEIRTSVRVAATQDGEHMAILGSDAHDAATTLIIPKGDVQGFIVDLLTGLKGLSGRLVVESRSDAGFGETIHPNQFVIALGERGGILSVLLGPVRLNFGFPSNQSLRDFGSAAIQAADALDRARPQAPKH